MQELFLNGSQYVNMHGHIQIDLPPQMDISAMAGNITSGLPFA